MLSDCYFYLGYINKQNFHKFQDPFCSRNQPDLIHILKISFDVEADTNLLVTTGKKSPKILPMPYFRLNFKRVSL